MVPRPGSTTPEDGVEIKQEPVAGAPSIGRSSVASHGSSDDHEVSDVDPPGATMDFDASRGPPGLKSTKAQDQ
ncbi:hypothetical protein PHMEG_0005840 [Phytophthora megakarya]|uniref:Eukaryotic/viral aspartic protease n=1 Tax=Phytophthora megakarya TaxID=4795 RepID=A0A225WQB1_9STRA|nr:hypothetical protein PHMEG_0005840 [Phytophthora megakarya]